VNLVLTLCDAGDSVVMYAPYYFNAYLSFQMTGVTNILIGESDP
jgi:aromatic aminotransferase